MDNKTICVLEKALEGEITVSSLAEKLGMDPWDVKRHLGSLRHQRYVSSDDSYVRLRNNEKVRLLTQLSKETDVKKILQQSNETVLSFLTEAITIEDLIEKTSLSRTTVYRALKDFNELDIIKKMIYRIQLNDSFKSVIELKDFNELDIIKKMIYRIQLNDSFKSVIDFANHLQSERKKLEKLK